MADDGRILVDEFRRNSLEVVRIHLQKFAGNEKQYFDIRVFMVDERPGAFGEAAFEGIATKKGITLDVELLDSLVLSLSRVRDILERGENGG